MPLTHQVFQRAMVRTNTEPCPIQEGPETLQRLNNGEQFLLMDRVVLLCQVELS